MPQALLLLVMSCIALLAAGVSGESPPPAPAPDCHKCGEVDVPYPFGIYPECSLPNFHVTCNKTTNPPILYTGNVRILSIALETPQIVVYNHFSSTCNDPNNGTAIRKGLFLNVTNTPFLISTESNMFTAVGCNATARLFGRRNGAAAARLAGCITYCAGVNEMDDSTQCRGSGCCEASITAGLTEVSNKWNEFNSPAYNPCQYAFVAKKGWYVFNKTDLGGNMSFARRNGYDGRDDIIPIVLDWAIRDGTCPPLPEDGNRTKLVDPYACISNHSYCVNASSGQQGYFCNCSLGYAGNPYMKDGCKDINECNSTLYGNPYPCHGGTCQNEDGGYRCKCDFGRRGDGKSDKGCEAILPLAAVAVIGTISAIAFLALLLIFLTMEHQKRKIRDRFNRNGGQLLKSIKIEIFTKEKLDQMTKNYSNIIGRGSFGEVYKGITSENVPIAVKRSIAIIKDRQKDLFANEITIQSKISHKNLVQLLGCCLETEIPMLVYEFVPRGSLYDVLHGKNGNGRRHPLALGARLDIAINSADAFAYMHSQASQKILHGDVKSANILLDDDFLPKVSDFGTSRLMSIEKEHTELVIGDKSYIDPVYMKTGLLTEKSDVYSFGVVLLELITGKMARYDGNNSLSLNYVKASMDKTTKQMYDTEITSTSQNINCLEAVGRIAVKCLEIDVNDRPTMTQIVEELKMLKIQWLQCHGQIGEADEICA